MRGFILFAILVIAHAHSTTATLVIKGPDKPVLENDEVTLECLLSDSELNTSQVHFEKFSKYMNKWYRLEEEPIYRRCIPGVILRREVSQLLLSIHSIHSYFHQGLYRCVADNATAPDNSSQPLAITINYMRELSVYDVSSSSRKFIKENLLVTLGDDVEVECSTTASEAPQYFWQKYGEDWIVPSSKLRLKNVRMEDGGDYTCMAEHPTLSSLKRSSTISITVLPACSVSDSPACSHQRPSQPSLVQLHQPGVDDLRGGGGSPGAHPVYHRLPGPQDEAGQEHQGTH
ncbi:sialic acid-binding Ig-like lectin 11 isoform X2 [Salmo trutta]|uniref:sialic acid-binding Ig-like lectin 11 isoform X2 n=1 Tax=Salmo trutta TaxID=8032 RepID=UPI0011312915|nr:sialic acid-binding Ig-like lectin 11 isoform X2 [Salmo trutta]